jgi:HPt (histidine-containing phosphotransfer) domain-containing protein
LIVLSSSDRIVVRVPADLAEYVPEFLSTTQSQLASSFDALAQGRFGAFRTLGHNIKGSAGSFGFDALGDLGRHLENAAVAGEYDRVRELAASIRDYLDRLEVEPE